MLIFTNVVGPKGSLSTAFRDLVCLYDFAGMQFQLQTLQLAFDGDAEQDPASEPCSGIFVIQLLLSKQPLKIFRFTSVNHNVYSLI